MFAAKMADSVAARAGHRGIRKCFEKVRSGFSSCFLAKQIRGLHHFLLVVSLWPWGLHVSCAR